MIYVHTYLTDGFFDMAKVFLESYVVAGNKLPVIIDSRGLSRGQVEELGGYSSVARINNEPLDWEALELKTGLNLSDLRQYKRQIESTYITPNSRVWKLLFAGDDRVKAVRKLLFQPETYQLYAPCQPIGLAHFDADTLFRADITRELIKMLCSHDASLKLRPNIKPIKARITIDCMILKACDAVKNFMDTWISIIDSVHPTFRPVGFGQSSCWSAYRMHHDHMSTATLPLKYGLPGRNAAQDVIWTGNIARLAKDDCVSMFRKELQNLKTKELAL